MHENREPVYCSACHKRISEDEDVLEYNGKNYCPTCYVNQVNTGTSPLAIFMTIIGIIMFICFILLWII